MKRKRGVDDEESKKPVENDDVIDEQPKIKKRRLMTANPPEMMFHDVCVCLDAIERSKKHSKKHFQDFLKQYRNMDFYPFVRLFLPDYDTERGHFGIQERKICDIYGAILMLTNEKKRKLKEWKGSGGYSTKFSEHIYEALVEQGLPIDQHNKRIEGALSVTQINEWLDSLHAIEGKKISTFSDKFRKIMFRLSALEHKFLIRIILKSMKIHFGKKLFDILHPDAKRLHDNHPDLKYVCRKVRDGWNLDLRDESIMPFIALNPMLARKGHPEVLKRFLDGTEGGEVFVEPKFDGERVLVHYAATTPSGGTDCRIEYYTRRGNNYNHIYEKFNGVVRSCLRKRFTNCILDGEMLVYDEKMDCLKEFGHNRSEQEDHEHYCYQCFDILYVDGKEITDMPYTDRKNMIQNKIRTEKKRFEVVKGEIVTGGEEEINQKLRDAVADGNEGIMLKRGKSKYQMNLRNDWMKYKPYYLQHIDLLIVGCFFGTKFNKLSPSDFLCGIRQSNVSLENNQEQKRRKSKEKKRRRNEENDDDDDDDDDDEREVEEEGEAVNEFFTFTKIGTGFSRRTLEELQTQLKPHWVKYNPDRPPRWMVGRPPPASAEKYTPRYVIDDPQNSQVLEVKCDAVVETNKYGMQYTLRHGRALRVRYDKSWQNCCSMEGFKKFQRNLQTAHLRKIQKVDDGSAYYMDKNKKGKKKANPNSIARRTVEPTVSQSFRRAVDPNAVEVEGNVLRGQEFVIRNWEDYDRDYKDKAALERIIYSQGGTVAMNDKAGRTTAIIASRKDIRVNNLILSKLYDVIKPSWLVEIDRKKTIVPLRSKHLIFATERTKNDIAQRVDKYGDLYTQEISKEDFLIFRDHMIKFEEEEEEEVEGENEQQQQKKRMKDEDDNDNDYIEQKFRKKIPKASTIRTTEKIVLKDESFPRSHVSPISFFRNCKFYLDVYANPGDPSSEKEEYFTKLGWIGYLIKIHSGTIVDSPRISTLDYIVVDPERQDRLEAIERAMLPPKDRIDCVVVPYSYIEDCDHRNRKLVPAGPDEIKLLRSENGKKKVMDDEI